MANFVYVVMDEESREALVVDSGWETEPVVKASQEMRAKVGRVVLTHEHIDHSATVAELAGALGAKVVAHESSPVQHDVAVTDGDSLRLGKKDVKVIHTPGHTDDSICLYDGGHLFTGDTLFVGTIGKFAYDRAGEMYDSLHGPIMKLPDSTILYPGHDYGEVPFRTLAEEKSSNPFLLTRDRRSFMSLFA